MTPFGVAGKTGHTTSQMLLRDSLLPVERLATERVVGGERAELFLFGIQAPAAEYDPQAGHDWNGEIDSQNAGDFASGHHAENRG